MNSAQVLHNLTEGSTSSQELIATVKKLYETKLQVRIDQLPIKSWDYRQFIDQTSQLVLPVLLYSTMDSNVTVYIIFCSKVHTICISCDLLYVL